MIVAHILLGFFACAATILALGMAAVRALRLQLSPLECICLGYAVGSPLASSLALALASLWVARKGVLLLIGVLSIILLWRQIPWFLSLKPTPTDSISGSLSSSCSTAWFIDGRF